MAKQIDLLSESGEECEIIFQIMFWYKKCIISAIMIIIIILIFLFFYIHFNTFEDHSWLVRRKSRTH